MFGLPPPQPPPGANGPFGSGGPQVGALRAGDLGEALESLLDAVWRAEREWVFDDRLHLSEGPVKRLISGEVYAARHGARWSWAERG